jgi:uncharacterized protein YkwD
MNRFVPAAAAAAAVAALVLTGAGIAGPPRSHDSLRPADRASAPSAQRVEAAADLERQTLVAINDLRREHGLRPLRPNPALAAAAREHSRQMAEHGFFRHESMDGSPFWKRIEAVYPVLEGRSWTVGENLVWAYPSLSAQGSLDLWLKSQPHRKNLLSPSWREIGLGGVRALAAPGVYDGLDATILTVDFGAR